YGLFYYNSRCSTKEEGKWGGTGGGIGREFAINCTGQKRPVPERDPKLAEEWKGDRLGTLLKNQAAEQGTPKPREEGSQAKTPLLRRLGGVFLAVLLFPFGVILYK
ncbi:MAG: hypothetical protein ACPGWR_18840, partial [Ardenticatenaceae bacterium]